MKIYLMCLKCEQSLWNVISDVSTSAMLKTMKTDPDPAGMLPHHSLLGLLASYRTKEGMAN